MAEARDPYVHRVRVRYGEVDMQGVVFNAHYLAFCDDAVDTWLRSVDVHFEDAGWDLMLKKAVVEWQGAATIGDELAIAVGVTRWGNTSFDVGFAGRAGEREVFTATITYVGVATGSRTPMPAPAEIRKSLDVGELPVAAQSRRQDVKDHHLTGVGLCRRDATLAPGVNQEGLFGQPGHRGTCFVGDCERGSAAEFRILKHQVDVGSFSRLGDADDQRMAQIEPGLV